MVCEDFYDKSANDGVSNNELLTRINENERVTQELIEEVKYLKKRLSMYEDLQHPIIEKYGKDRSYKSWSETTSLEGDKTSKIN